MDADVVILGAGAAGLMCAIEAGRRGRRVVVIDHAAAPGEKIRISGGGRCNFTNLGTHAGCFLGENPKFALSALGRFGPRDFLARVEAAGIAWHEKAEGQLFCDGSARQIVAMLVDAARGAGVDLRLATPVGEVGHGDGRFRVAGIAAPHLVVATGGLSIPKMGATGLAYDLARQFGVAVVPTRPGLVPLTFSGAALEGVAALAGVGVPARVRTGPARFDGPVLFTHRGLSGPAILQVSSYWHEGAAVTLDLVPGGSVEASLRAAAQTAPRQSPAAALAGLVPRRLAEAVVAEQPDLPPRVADLGRAARAALAARLSAWEVRPMGTEGYRTAEVTLGGVDTKALDARTLAVKALPGLHFIGEAVDITGWLGGHNFQWAWASGWAAGQAV